MTTITGTAAANTLNGDAGGPDADLIRGLGGNDSLFGGALNDTLQGGAYDDTLDGGTGLDSLAGDAGADELLVRDGDAASGGIGDAVIRLVEGGLVGFLNGEAGTDTLRIENYADLTDFVASVSGIEVWDNSAGYYLEGTSSGDTVDLTGVSSGSYGFIFYAHGGADLISGLRVLGNTIHGGDGNDTLTGGDFNDVLNGEADDDVLRGGGATDYLDGGLGIDSLAGEGGDDELTIRDGDAGDGGIDHDVFRLVEGGAVGFLNGGTGTDTLRIENYADLTDFVASLSSIELWDNTAGYYTEGSDLADAVDLSAMSIVAGSFGFTYFAYAGADLVTGLGAAGSLLYGGDGDDILTGGSSSDSLLGEGDDDFLHGGGGGDTLDGGLGEDDLFGEEGDDELLVRDGDAATGGAGVDLFRLVEGGLVGFLNGDVGVDTLRLENYADFTDFVAAASGIEVWDNTAGYYVEGTEDADTFDLAGMTTLAGSFGLSFHANAGGDLVTGLGDSGNAIHGGGGNDTLTGGVRADSLHGEADDDIMFGGRGADTLDGGEGDDTASWAGVSARVNASLAAGLAISQGDATDTLTSIEGLIGSEVNDTLVGDLNANTLAGGAGNDTIEGGDGADSLDGGAGVDTVSYATAAAAVSVAVNGKNQNTGGAGVDTLSNFEHVTGSAFKDNLRGDGGANSLIGGGGDDTLSGGLGDDSLAGANGTDTASYNTSTAPVTVDLALSVAQNTGGAGLDTLSAVENLTGGSGNDSLYGAGGGNELRGGLGADRLEGREGADKLFGQDGEDTLVCGAGKDQLTGGAGADVFVFLDATDSPVGKSKRDTIKDFDLAGGDVIDLSGIDAIAGGGDDAFTIVATFTGVAGQLIVQDKGAYTLVRGDVDGIGGADFEIYVDGATPPDAADFVL